MMLQLITVQQYKQLEAVQNIMFSHHSQPTCFNPDKAYDLLYESFNNSLLNL